MQHDLEHRLTALTEQVLDAHVKSPADRAPVLLDLARRMRTLYDEMEGLFASSGAAATDRPLIPLFRRWMQAAREIVTSVREVRASGIEIARVDDLVRAVNYAKAVAEDFDQTVEVNERVARGEDPVGYRPLSEIMDELQARTRSAS